MIEVQGENFEEREIERLSDVNDFERGRDQKLEY